MEGQGVEAGRVGHYVLGRTIGKGGFARVKEARHEPTGAAVAVKILNKAKMQNKNMISKVRREINILRFLSHPRIIKLYEVLDSTDDIFVVMELANGGELYERLQTTTATAPEPHARQFFAQIMEGVEFAHLNLVAHRDLKPENILLDRNGMVKIADFGLSNLMRDGRLLRTQCGSLNYAAPEVIAKRAYEGTAVDVWSCGVILFTMLTGTLPFDEEAVALLSRKIEKAEYVVPEGVSALAADLIRRMLCANPTQRLRVAQIRRHPWLRPHLPLYASLSFFSETLREEEAPLNMQVLQQVRGYNMESLRGLEDEQRIAKIIQRRMDDSFVTAYQLLKDQQQAHQPNDHLEQPPQAILAPVPSRLPSSPSRADALKFGVEFGKTAKIVMGVLLEVFVELSVSFEVKDVEYCLLCTYLRPLRRSRKRSSHQLSENKIYGYQDEMRFVTTHLRFALQLYAPHDGRTILDLRLTQGHPLVFLAFARDLAADVQRILEQ